MDFSIAKINNLTMSSTFVLPPGCIVIPPATLNPAFMQLVWNILAASASQMTAEEKPQGTSLLKC